METYQKVQSHNLKTFNNSAVTCSLSFDSLIVGDGGQGLKVLATNRNPLIASSGSMPATGEGGGVAVASKKELNARPSIVWSEGVDSSDPSFVNKSEMVGDSQPFVVPGKAHMARLASAEKKVSCLSDPHPFHLSLPPSPIYNLSCTLIVFSFPYLQRPLPAPPLCPSRLKSLQERSTLAPSPLRPPPLPPSPSPPQTSSPPASSPPPSTPPRPASPSSNTQDQAPKIKVGKP